MSSLRQMYLDGRSAGYREAEWALFEGRANHDEREQVLRDEAASYTMPTPDARRLRAYMLGYVRGYREVLQQVWIKS